MISAIIVAAGVGERVNSVVPKQYLPLMGKPVLAHTLDAFENCPAISEIVVVISPFHREIFLQEVMGRFSYKRVREFVFGGSTRQESVYQGLKVIKERGESQFVLIHDGVRPLISQNLLKRCIEGVREHQAVCSAVPCVDTLKFTRDGKTIEQTLDRTKIWRAQTPQAFEISLIWEAFQRAEEDGFAGTDDASLVERLGKPVYFVTGSEENLKITTPEDFLRAEEWLRWKDR
ncbi:MAG: 2-C-methyl-D-erythritol 4-phosphate cytidylyltransferase [Candidatus Atribacteria bacterium]|nr:2-C-methyl-D-erythritol 4-phosphate cytidylyltransferase [Candidatus Atribacteria bacterium]